MTTYFVAGTGTGVGKTFTTCALLHAANQRAQAVRGFKPVLSGWDGNDDNDAAQILAANRHTQRLEEVAPWRFVAPLSPHRAAALEGKSIDTDALIAWTRAQMGGEGVTLIETVGGVMVPLTNDFTTLDWMEAVAAPVVLVTGSYLGSISHTLTALAALRSRNLNVAALVMNEAEGSSVTLAEAEAGLAPFIQDIPLQIIQPRVSSWQQASAIHTLELV